MRDPRARAGAHDGLERRDHAARRDLHHGARRTRVVDVRFAIGDDEHFRSAQMIAHDLLQRLRRPVLVKVDLESLGRFDFAQHAANLRQNRARSGLRACIVQETPAANVADQHSTQRLISNQKTKPSNSASTDAATPASAST